MKSMNVDKVWQTVGIFGNYQKLQVLWFTLGMVAVAYQILVYVFVAFRPPFTCKPPLNGSSIDANGLYGNLSTVKLKENACDFFVLTKDTNRSTIRKPVPCNQGYDYDISQETIVTEWDLVCDSQGKSEFSQSVITIGQTVGGILFLPLADRYGRKKIFVSTGILTFVASTVITLSPNYYMYVVFKFFIGAGLEGYGMVLFIYVFEMFSGKSRGWFGIYGSFLWTTNVVSITALGYGLRNFSWRYLQIATGLVCFPSLLYFWLCDESLRWLLANNKIKEARTLIIKIAKKNGKDSEYILKILQEGIPLSEKLTTGDIDIPDQESYEDHHGEQDAKSDKPSILDVFRNKTLTKRTFIWMFIWFTNNVTYNGLLLSSVQLKGNRFLNYFVNGIVEMPSNVLFCILLNRVDRRKLCILFHLMVGIPMIASAILITFKDRHESFETAAIVLSFVGKMGVTGSYNTIFVYLPETYPTNFRNIGLGLSSMSSHIGGIIAPFSTLLAYHVEWGPGVIFGVFCMVVSLLCLMLPETRQKQLPQTLAEIE